MATAQNLIEASLRLIDQLQPGYTASDDHYTTCLEALNRMLGEWAAAGAMVYSLSMDTFTGDGSKTYAWGSGGTLTTTKPVRIKSQGQTINLNNLLSQPFTFVSEEDYMQHPDTSAVGFPDIAFYDYALPTGTLHLYPAPPANYRVNLWSWKALSDLSLSSTLSLPAGYEAALKYNLAVAIAPEFRRQVPDLVASLAGQTKAQLSTLAAQILGPIIDMPQAGRQ